jgi:DNA-directed RNA polymerase subunit L
MEVLTNNQYKFAFKVRNVPVSFVNAVRRSCLSHVNTVVARHVEIQENTSQLPYEMLKHRVEMLPINVLPNDVVTIRNAKIILDIKNTTDKVMTVTTDDFKFENASNILMKDRDFEMPLLFLYLQPNESVKLTASLVLENEDVSQVSLCTTQWHVDGEMLKQKRQEILEAGEDIRLFDNFSYQRYYERDEKGRPVAFDFSIESIGVMKCTDILRSSMIYIRKLVANCISEMLQNIQREADNVYIISIENGEHTFGALMQEAIYSNPGVNFISYDIPHPLIKKVVFRLQTTLTPESVIESARNKIDSYCVIIERSL